VNPRPPDFNHLFAANARHDFGGFRAGCVVTVRVREGRDLLLPTGRLVACEPGALTGYDAGDYAFVQRVPPGTYPVELVMADFHDPGNPQGNTRFSQVAAARVRVRENPVASWRPALQSGQDEELLKGDEVFGYPVDGGVGSFSSPEAIGALSDVYERDPDEWFAVLTEIVEDDDVVSYVGDETGANVVMFRSGGGDGHYGTWVGYTAEGEVACFVTDFHTLSAHADEDECEYCAAGFSRASAPPGSGPAPAAPGHQLSGPASYAAGSVMLVGQSLRRQSLTSQSGSCTLVYQDDGNLVLYRYDRDRAVWASNTQGASVGELVLQTDGNLVLYDREGHAVWATGTDGRPAARLTVRDEAVVVLEAVDGSELWAAGEQRTKRPRPAIAGIRSRSVPAKATSAASPRRTGHVSSPGVVMVEPYGGGSGFRFKIRDVKIDGVGDTVRVRTGGVHQLSFDLLHDCAECGNAVNQVIVGLAGQDRAQASVWNGKQRSGGGLAVVNPGSDVEALAQDNPGPAEWVSVSCEIVVPDEPGMYSVRARYAQAYQGRLMTVEGRAVPQPEYQDVLGWWKVDRPDGPGPESAIGTIIVG